MGKRQCNDLEVNFLEVNFLEVEKLSGSKLSGSSNFLEVKELFSIVNFSRKKPIFINFLSAIDV